jgi:hypothetical protein
MSMIVWMLGLPRISDLYGSAAIVTISIVRYMLYSTIREVDTVLPLNVTSLIPRSLFMEVCVMLVIMHSILIVERIRLLIIMITTMTTTLTTTTNSSRKAECMAC